MIHPGLYTRAVAGLLFPMHELFKRHRTVHVRAALERSQYLAPPQLQVLQCDRLRRLLLRAQQQSPYYRELFAAIGFDAAREVHGLDVLQRLPLLDKALIRSQGERLRAANARGLARFTTGGSSGEPLVFEIGRERVSHDVAAKWRATRWWDVDIGDREMVVWGSPIELQGQDRVKRWRDRLLRTELLPAFAMSDSRLDDFIARIRARRPRMLFGYPSALAHMARHAQARGAVLDNLGIKVAFVTSERLYPEQRALIGRTFGCPVANGYGGRDAGFIAHECPQGGMHITAEDIVVEILDAAGQPVPPGASGEIVVTHLATGDFPFIRYRTGDIGALASALCACGRTLPLLRDIEGRSTDFVIAADGTVLHGLALIYIVRELPGITAFKIIQESLALVRVQLVLAHAIDAALRDRIVAGVRQRLGASVAVAVEQVDAIAPEASGKFRYVVSRLDAWTRGAMAP
jgi:phenylacetate-CoA ligase